jgi:hypothetical protein
MTPRIARLLWASAILTLIALALMVWSVVQPTPLPTIVAMSLGQLVGTAAFALYLLAIVIDLRHDARMRRRRPVDSLPPPIGPRPPTGEEGAPS